MPVWPRRILIILGVVLVIAGAAYYWLFVDSRPPSDASYALDIDRLRAAVDTVPGDKPSSRFRLLAWSQATAGTAWRCPCTRIG
jgi:hypothetical protein